MVDRALVTSGFDIEILLSGRYLRYALLAQLDAGLFPTVIDVAETDPGTGVETDVTITIHPPEEFDRRYEPDPAAPLPAPAAGSFETEILPADPTGANLHAAFVVDVRDNLTGETRSDVTIGILLAMSVTADTDDRGFERNHQLAIEMVDFDALTLLALAFAAVDVDSIRTRVKAQLDRTVPFGVAGGQAVQQVALVVHPVTDGHPAAFGAYIDLALRNGPEPDAFRDPRGDETLAQNFLEPDVDVAFATGAGLYQLLGPDQRFRMAESNDSGGFSFPLREDPNDPESDVVGRVLGISVRPERVGFPAPVLTGRLEIDVHGVYTDSFIDTEFHLQVFLRPVVRDGLVTWDAEVDMDVSILATLLGVLLMVGAAVFIGPGAAVGVFLVLIAANVIVDELATARARDQFDESDASFLDALPFRVAVAQRRWDPFYATDHQVLALVDTVTIDDDGIAFEGVAAVGRAPVPVNHVVIRDEERDGSQVSHLRYRVRDAGRFADDFVELAPATDRREFRVADPAEPTLVSLTTDQIISRMSTDPLKRRLRELVRYQPHRVHLFEHRIDSMLVISTREIDEQRAALREADPDLDEDEVAARLPLALDRTARFDLRPDEFADLQRKRALVIEGKEIITMRRDGRTTVYFRDRPDGTRRDNLLTLPRYSPPYEPPP